MAEPSGKIVARPMVARACGCLQEFQHYQVDKYREQRLAKFQRTRCAACAAKLVEEQRRVAALVPRKGEALQSLPPGTQITMARNPDGTWAGTLSGSGTTVGGSGDGTHGLTVLLARLWLAARSAGNPGEARQGEGKP